MWNQWISGSVTVAMQRRVYPAYRRVLRLRDCPGRGGPRVPHISLVFREIWDTTDADR